MRQRSQRQQYGHVYDEDMLLESGVQQPFVSRRERYLNRQNQSFQPEEVSYNFRHRGRLVSDSVLEESHEEEAGPVVNCKLCGVSESNMFSCPDCSDSYDQKCASLNGIISKKRRIEFRCYECLKDAKVEALFDLQESGQSLELT